MARKEQVRERSSCTRKRGTGIGEALFGDAVAGRLDPCLVRAPGAGVARGPCMHETSTTMYTLHKVICNFDIRFVI